MAHKKGPNTKPMTKEDKDVLLRYGQLIRKYRKQSPYSRIDLCRILNVSNSQLSAWEIGKAEPRLHTVLKLCGLLHIPLDELLYNIDSLNLSVEESNLIKATRKLNTDIRNILLQLVESLVYQQSGLEENNEAIDKLTGIDSYATDGSIIEQPVDTDEAIIEEIFETPNPVPAQEETIAKETEPIKRRRGRPRKYPLPEQNTVQEEPQKAKTEASEYAIPTPEDPPKRKRGRPKKEPQSSLQTSPLPLDTQKKKRGRPKKQTQTTLAIVTEVADPPKRKRGRPKKQA